MDNNIIDKRTNEVAALNNALNYYNLTGYKIHEYYQEDKRRVKPLYFLTDEKGTSLTGHWDYSELNSFIRGYGKSFTERKWCVRIIEEQKTERESLVKEKRELLEALKGVLDYRSLSVNSSVDYRNKFTENTNKALEAIKKHSPIN